MVRPAYDLFVALVLVLAMAVVGLARASARLLSQEESLATPRAGADLESDATLLLNLSITHLGVALAVGAILWLTKVPLESIGVGTRPDLLSAALLGIGIYVLTEGFEIAARSWGYDEPETLREFLAPEDWTEWVLLLVVVLPVIAFGEELLFRGALIGGVAAATDLSPWLLALVSSVGFGFAHAAQGSIGVLATGVLGFALAAVFVVTGNLWLVVVAHYLINALQFVVHEGLGVEFG